MDGNFTMTSGTLTGQVLWNGVPVIDDGDEGSAGALVPSRPRPPSFPPVAAALPMPEDTLLSACASV